MSTDLCAGDGRIIAPLGVNPLVPVACARLLVSIAPSHTAAAHAAGLANAVE
jgi:hypothetical protein